MNVVRPHSDRQRGFVMVTMILSLVALLSFLGLGIDVGYQEFVKTRMQSAADAAAIGAAQELRSSGSDNMVAAARADAAANGFTNGQNSVTVTVNNPPATGFSTADSNAVEVLIQQDVPTFFMAVLGFSTGRVQARAVAHLGNSSNCVFALDPTASGAVSGTGGSTEQFSCGLMVNSNSTSALSISGGAQITAGAIGIVGQYSSSGGSTLSPTPVQGLLPELDPLARTPVPTVGNCDFTNYKLSGGNSDALTPGTYCKGITLTGGATVTMAAGTYILKGGGMSLSGGSSLTGTGVTIYNTYASGYSYQPISFNGGTTVSLTAPTTGPLAGILIFQDPTLVSGGNSTLNGGATMTLNGALYFPTTAVDFSGGASGVYTILVAKTISFTGGTVFRSDYSSLPGGSPVKGSATLSE